MTDLEKTILLEWDIILRNVSDFVRIAKVNGIKFEIRTNEQGRHNTPHFHVSTSSASLSMAIETGEILAISGKISPPQISKAEEWLKEHKTLVKKYWNEFSNGITIPIN